MCVGLVHKAKTPQILCLNERRGEAKGSYTQEDVKDPVKVNAKVNCHGIQHNVFNENNVAVQKIGTWSRMDPGVRSAPFVNSVISVPDTQEGNVVQSNEYANSEDACVRYSKNS